MDNAIFELLQRVANEDDDARRAELRAQSDEELGQHFHRHPGDLEELGFDLLNNAWADTMQQDIVPQLIEVKTVGLGETDYLDEDLRGQRAYWQGKGGQILSDVIRYERTWMPREEMVTAIDFHIDDLATRFWGTFDKLSAQSREKLRQLPAIRLVELVRAAITGGVFFGTFPAATLSSAQIDTVLGEVAARSDGNVTIVGTRIALSYLANIGLEFGDNVREQVFRTGQIGTYKGFGALQVENFEDFAGNFVLPNNELWLVGRNAGRLTYYGEGAKVQQLQLPSFWRRWETARDAGMLLYGAGRGRIGRIVLT
jgi:hypothetical protein